MCSLLHDDNYIGGEKDMKKVSRYYYGLWNPVIGIKRACWIIVSVMLIEMYPKDPRICFENEAMLRLGNMYLGEACLLSKPLALCKTLYELCQARINS